MKSAEVADCFRHCKEVVMVEEEAEMRAKKSLLATVPQATGFIRMAEIIFHSLRGLVEVITTAALFVSVSPSALVVTFIIQCYLLVELCCWLICTTDRVEASIDNGSCCYIRGQLGGNIIW
ncbi:hypothetical protein EGR_09036 [Echinococcus granulosus]|uniref:Uncharacterized protein n=1 Tax=Echinococcus granulosus TaxID=6210 RepID=W6UCT9_ECHGR|nr:hypothetical protein EGR_09036 [Echinococcus granulosus]EUB56097.1 hypothetical protein EGR_09036 [Echinococcus granulosus]